MVCQVVLCGNFRNTNHVQNFNVSVLSTYPNVYWFYKFYKPEKAIELINANKS